MAAEEATAGVGGTRRALSAIMFMQSGTLALDVYSATNSSPWTAENFGADPEKVASLREYVTHALVLSSAYGLVSSVLASSWWPIAGVALGDIYMWWLYERAIARGSAAGSDGWADA